ncbi:hypothetical protein [Burkholderia sp. WP9]|uniref:hypothetical protein n=1 Tax=Burkholderia sp. WP9 TaxID=1500263 RepID=UPI0015A5ED08|nr:hypothetical protein [Burkholderia sp. WP9]
MVELHCFVSLHQFIDRDQHGHAVSQLILVWKHHASGTPARSWSLGKAPSPIAMTRFITFDVLDDATKFRGLSGSRTQWPARRVNGSWQKRRAGNRSIRKRFAIGV